MELDLTLETKSGDRFRMQQNPINYILITITQVYSTFSICKMYALIFSKNVVGAKAKKEHFYTPGRHNLWQRHHILSLLVN